MKKILCILNLFLLAITIYPEEQEFPHFKLITEELKPFNFCQNGEASGISIEILNLIFEMSGSSQKANHAEFLPWARGYFTAQKEPLNILFVTARTAERENEFKWVGPIFTDRTEAFALKKRKIKINSPNDFSNYIISSYIGDSQEELISNLGIKIDSLDRLTSSEARFKKLYSGRSDIVFTSRITFLDYLHSQKIDPNIFESIYELESIDICYAFSKDTPDWVIEKFQSALNELHKNGTIAKLFDNYGLSWHYEKPVLE